MEEKWNYTILDADVPAVELCSLITADVDGDGHVEIITGGNGSLLWYRPDTLERGVVYENHFHIGIALEDIDADGKAELVTGEEKAKGSDKWCLTWYKIPDNLHETWERHVIDENFEGGPHDILFADIDSDGVSELIAIACYSPTPGIFAFKKNLRPEDPWTKYPISEGVFTEGLSAGDLDGDGKIEIVCGPDWYKAPDGGALSGHWVRHVYAPDFREMCRTKLLDITGNGRPDIVITDSEYMDGYISFFENRLLENTDNPWIEHRLKNNMVYSHSLDAFKDGEGTHIFAAEMMQGGWNAPLNHGARLMEFITKDNGKSFKEELIYTGEGTHQALAADIDNDGEMEIVGKTAGAYWGNPKLQLWKKPKSKNILGSFKHQFIDRDKPHTAVDILPLDIDGDGIADIVCGEWWYKSPSWERRHIPGIIQVINAYDLDHDGKKELIAIKKPEKPSGDFYNDLNSSLVWLKAVDPVNDNWEIHYIGKGTGDWPHGSLIASFMDDGSLSLIIGYHDASKNEYPDIFTVPKNPTEENWPMKTLADIPYGEEFAVSDVDGDGRDDVVAGMFWLENKGGGSFAVHKITDDFKAARLIVTDVNGDGRPDVVMGEEVLDFVKNVTPFSRVAWFENPGDKNKMWKMHVIDSVRCAHSIGAADFDNDGETEIVAGEHDPFYPYRSQCHIYVYKKADKPGLTWNRFTVDDRFESHDGTKVIKMPDGRYGIISHGWRDSIYVNLWTL